jgi:hypothetical protein
MRRCAMDAEKVVGQIIARHGEVIDLRRDPRVIIDIIRTFAPIVADDGGLPGGVPPSPPPGPAPGPAGFGDPVTNTDIMKELLRVSRSVETLTARRPGGGGFFGFLRRLFS